MDQMYAMGVTIHSIGIIALILAIMLNFIVLFKAQDVVKYKRLRSIVLLPLNSMLVAAAIFTGAIMMAAKHLDFTLENIVMIIAAVLLIAKEVKRSKALKHIDEEDFIDFVVYKQFAYKLITFELTVVVVISLWMWFVA